MNYRNHPGKKRGLAGLLLDVVLAYIFTRFLSKQSDSLKRPSKYAGVSTVKR